MKRVLVFSFLVLAVTASVASADRGRHRGHWKKHRDATSWRSGGVVVRPAPVRAQRARPRVVRRPIYVQRPVIQYRYYNYAQRPAVLAENYPARAGYYWVAGQWQWNGYEWIWQPGHYQPDPSYQSYSYSSYSTYDNGYDGGYYDSGYQDGGYYDGGYYAPQPQPGISVNVGASIGGSIGVGAHVHAHGCGHTY